MESIQYKRKTLHDYYMLFYECDRLLEACRKYYREQAKKCLYKFSEQKIEEMYKEYRIIFKR